VHVCLNKGASSEDINDIVHGMQAKLLFDLCYLLVGDLIVEKELAGLTWGLFPTDEDGRPVAPSIGDLHGWCLTPIRLVGRCGRARRLAEAWRLAPSSGWREDRVRSGSTTAVVAHLAAILCPVCCTPKSGRGSPVEAIPFGIAVGLLTCDGARP
jgi:hypothetical protein